MSVSSSPSKTRPYGNRTCVCVLITVKDQAITTHGLAGCIHAHPWVHQNTPGFIKTPLGASKHPGGSCQSKKLSETALVSLDAHAPPKLLPDCTASRLMTSDVMWRGSIRLQLPVPACSLLHEQCIALQVLCPANQTHCLRPHHVSFVPAMLQGSSCLLSKDTVNRSTPGLYALSCCWDPPASSSNTPLAGLRLVSITASTKQRSITPSQQNDGCPASCRD